MRRGRVGQQAFLLGVAVEAGDGGQPPSDRGPGPAPLLEVAGEALDIRPTYLEQGHVVLVAPGDELAQVQDVRVAGHPAVAGQEAGQGELLGVAERGVGDDDGCRWDCAGHVAPPGRAETRRPERPRPSDGEDPTIRTPIATAQCGQRAAAEPRKSTRAAKTRTSRPPIPARSPSHSHRLFGAPVRHSGRR
jgi:hypothetical protein